MTDAFIKLLEDKAKMLLTDTVALDSLFWEQAVQRWETEIMPSMIPNGSQTWTFRLPVASLQATKTSASQIYSRWLEKGELPIFRYMAPFSPGHLYRSLILAWEMLQPGDIVNP